jgi:hypothetical protein
MVVVKLRRSSSKTNLTAESGGVDRTSHSAALQQTEPPDSSLAAPASGFLAKVTCWQQRIDPEVEVNLNRRKKQQRPASIAGSEAVSLKAVGGALKRVPSLGSMPVHAFGVNAAQLCLSLSAPPPPLPLPAPFDIFCFVATCLLFLIPTQD